VRLAGDDRARPGLPAGRPQPVPGLSLSAPHSDGREAISLPGTQSQALHGATPRTPGPPDPEIPRVPPAPTVDCPREDRP
jgi:hypothetical protein